MPRCHSFSSTISGEQRTRLSAAHLTHREQQGPVLLLTVIASRLFALWLLVEALAELVELPQLAVAGLGQRLFPGHK